MNSQLLSINKNSKKPRPIQSITHDSPITSSLSAFNYLNPLMRKDVEEFWCVALDSLKNVIKSEMLFRGTVDSCLVHPRDIFRFAITTNSSSILIAHNHPSNNPQPSPEDNRLTEKIQKAGKLLQIPVIDHLILAESGFYSFADSGRLK